MADSRSARCESEPLLYLLNDWPGLTAIHMLDRQKNYDLTASLLALAGLACRQAGSGEKLPALVHVEDIAKLSPEQVKEGYPMRLKGSVTYYDPEWHIFFQDSTNGIYIDPQGQDFKVQAGDVVEIEGSAGPSGLGVVKPRLKVLGQAPLPTPKRVLAALGWAVVLKRRVREQTETIRRRLESEAALEQHYRERCLAAGMDGCLSKPIRPDELFRAIDDLIETPATVKDVGHRDHSETVFDQSAFIARADGDVELARELVEIFFDDSPKHIAAIRAAVNRRDSAALERAAHTMKGVLGYFAADRGVEAALQLQQMGETGDFTGAQEPVAALEAAVESLKPSLAAFVREYAL